MIVKLLAKSRKPVNLEVATNGFDPKKTLFKLSVIYIGLCTFQSWFSHFMKTLVFESM